MDRINTVHVVGGNEESEILQCALGQKVQIVTHEYKTPVVLHIAGQDPQQSLRHQVFEKVNSVAYFPCVAFASCIHTVSPDVYCYRTCVLLRTNLGDFYQYYTKKPVSDAKVRGETVFREFAKQIGLGMLTTHEIAAQMVAPVDDEERRSYFDRNREWAMLEIFKAAWTQFVRNFEMLPKLAVDMVMHKNVPFIDIQTNLTQQPEDIPIVMSKLAERLLYDTVVVADARGFLLAGTFLKKGVRVVMARKPGKLPKPTHNIMYGKEYESADEISIDQTAIPPGSHVLIVDDVMASGGTFRAIEYLVEIKCKSHVVGFLALFAIEKAPGELLCKSLPMDKVRFAQTQMVLPNYSCESLSIHGASVSTLDNSGPIAILPPSLHTFSPRQRAPVRWNKYGSSSNILFDGTCFANRNVEVYVNTTHEEEMYEVLSLLRILYRKDAKSIKVIIAFVEQGTQDRIEFTSGGMESLAQVDTLSRMIGKFTVLTYDIHALQSRLVFYDNRNESIVEKLWADFHVLYPDVIAVFPDKGAELRFGKFLNITESVVFQKTRGEGTVRKVKTESKTEPNKDYVIIDDLVRTGSTMFNVAQYLIEERQAKSVSALFAHGPFEPGSAKYLQIFEGRIHTSNSVPDKVPSEWVHYTF